MQVLTGRKSGKRRGRLVGTGAAIALSLGALTTAVASPASAASQGAAICGGKYYFNNNTAAVQVDNCPGSGASWGWVWANDDWSWADLNVRLTDGTQTTVSTDGGTAKSKTFNADIASWQICGHYWSWVGWPHYTDTCSAWFS